MYQVIKMYGDFEPWWFLEDWKDDIIWVEEFKESDDARQYYINLFEKLKDTFPSFESRANLLATFWDRAEQRWCEECDEYLQQYHSIALLKNGEVLSVEFHDQALELSNDKPNVPSACALK